MPPSSRGLCHCSHLAGMSSTMGQLVAAQQVVNLATIQVQARGGQPSGARGLSEKPGSSPLLCDGHSLTLLPTNLVLTTSTSISPSTFHQGVPLMAERCMQYREVPSTTSWVRVADSLSCPKTPSSFSRSLINLHSDLSYPQTSP